MYIIDTHVHLHAKQFANDIDEVVKRSINDNVRKMILPSVDLGSIKYMLDIAKKYPQNCFPTIGIHPKNIEKDPQKQIDKLKSMLTKDNYYAIGECGLDWYWDNIYKKQYNRSFREEQQFAFREHIKLAIEYRMPLIIHARNSINDIINTLEDYSNSDLRGVFHCFNGNNRQAEIIAKLGFKLGIGGIITHGQKHIEIISSKIPLNDMVLETDAPYLTPHPKRKERNESSFLSFVIAKLAELKNISTTEVIETTTQNAEDIFYI